jgi:hypothetical protein
MEDLYLNATRQTPEVDFRFSRHHLRMAGEAYPENAAAFFTPLIHACEAYLVQSGDAPVTIDLALRYLNSASTKLLFQFIGVFDRVAAAGRRVVVEFRHDPEDDMLIEFAQDLAADYSWVDVRLVEMA